MSDKCLVENMRCQGKRMSETWYVEEKFYQQKIHTWDDLLEPLKLVLPKTYTYILKNFNELPLYRTAENFEMLQFELNGFVNINSKEMAQEWFKAFELHSKTTMPQTKGYNVKGSHVLFQEKRHCAHSNEVKKKQSNREIKNPQSLQA
ncbi:hypothetical protein C2G38_2196156 [Gigaspora rosea]|uniref:Uncharacterized protein n=1 Tax=Gigaspora rosea TaxID=44941 RepID=A0A397V434_9GLOM|nr:hypothetical protein C2G38_2196156 [Gigaspora rosea]